MGEVYRAKDTRLNRTVAIKVLPAQVTDRADLRQRLEREARVISTLNHPHICTLHDIGHQNGIEYLVMEYLEGETLASRLLKGALPLDQALRYGIEIADALDQAHRHGITHRDLKPGNVMLTRSGAKLLDFGLAKFHPGTAPVLTGLSDMPTEGGERQSLTAEGVILGTLQYMAPEQLEGKEADARTDIFAFGAVVYEMATGHKAFQGNSQASLIAAILEHEIAPISALQPMTPPALDRVVKRCLAKDPEERWQTARDLTQELKWIAEPGSQAGQEATLGTPRKSHERLAWIVAAVLFLTTLGFASAYLRRAPVDVRAVRFTIAPPEKTRFLPYLSVSPDGRHVAFSATDASGKTQLWVRPLDSLSAQPLPGTEGGALPFWSPDSRFIGFFAQGKLKKTGLSGGPPQTLCDAPNAWNGTWNRDGMILFAPNYGPLYRVAAAGGEPSAVTTLDPSQQEISHFFPQFLPDGRHFLYLALCWQKQNSGIYIGSLDSKDRQRLLDAVSNAAYSPPGYVLFQRGGSLLAVPFDAEQLRPTGEPFPVAEQVQYNHASGEALFSVSQTGVVAYAAGTAVSQLTWFDRTGQKIQTVGPPGEYLDLDLSPDQKQVAVELSGPGSKYPDIWVIELSRGITSRLTTAPSPECCPRWSPDGSQILFNSTRDAQSPEPEVRSLGNLYIKSAKGSDKEKAIFKSSAWKIPEGWSRDGRFFLFSILNFGTGSQNSDEGLWALPLPGDPKPMLFLPSASYGQFSPDGRWVAYVSAESGGDEVYVRSFPLAEGKSKISAQGGGQPRWRGDGKELFYLAPSNKLMAVDVKAGAGFQASVARPLFETPDLPGITSRHQYAVTADGQRFLMIVTEAPRLPLTVVLNWTVELRR
jgi:serine/threonine protein kinase